MPGGEWQRLSVLKLFFFRSLDLVFCALRRSGGHMASGPIAPEDVRLRALQLGVDPAREPHLLWIIKLAVELPLPPGWEAVTAGEAKAGESGALAATVYVNEQQGERTTRHPADACVERQLSEERAKEQELPAFGAWMEFFDAEGLPYYFDFETYQLVRERPYALRLPPLARDAATRGARLPAAGAPAALQFRSWWNECGAFGSTRRVVDIKFNVAAGSFEVVIDGDDKVFTVSHIIGRHGPLEAWDLHVGAELDVLGRKTTLMQGSLATTEWIEAQAKRLLKLKARLEAELRKYETYTERTTRSHSTKKVRICVWWWSSCCACSRRDAPLQCPSARPIRSPPQR